MPMTGPAWKLWTESAENVVNAPMTPVVKKMRVFLPNAPMYIDSYMNIPIRKQPEKLTMSVPCKGGNLLIDKIAQDGPEKTANGNQCIRNNIGFHSCKEPRENWCYPYELIGKEGFPVRITDHGAASLKPVPWFAFTILTAPRSVFSLRAF